MNYTLKKPQDDTKKPQTKKRFQDVNVSLIAGIAIIAGLTLLGVVMTFWPLNNPSLSLGGRLEGPSARFWLGTDDIGRDTFTRVAQAALTGVAVSIAAAAGACMVGAVIGAFTGYVSGWPDKVIMRVVDALLAIPSILIVLILRLVLGTGVWQLVLALAFLYSPSVVRVIRSTVLVTRRSDFVALAEIAGVNTPSILLKYLLPNSLPTLLVQGASVGSNAVVLEAVLSYLGQGIQPPQPSAGRMLYEYTKFMQTSPMLLIAPAMVVFLLTVGWNLTADGLQRALLITRSGVKK
ncbi:MAG: ABC transporter permease [Propionibacteriaceae bacterium]|jgi:peptide/nickel transport system permease protein|nr:ABC transporter permease [Propionibacteriaceae bacterium]